MRIPLKGRAGMKIRAGDGWEELGFPEMMSTPLFYSARHGDRLGLRDHAYKFNVATYAPEIERRWIYTYDYSPNESWVVYNHDLSGGSYRQDDYIFSKQVYFRVCLRKVDGGVFNGFEDIDAILCFESDSPASDTEKPWLKAEVNRVAEKVAALRSSGEFAFVLLTDSHYTANGTWDDTAAAIRRTHEAVGIDGIIHLGDFTDGMVTGEVTRNYVSKSLNALKNCGVPVWAALGNHDSNYFRENPERFSFREQCELYLVRNEPRYRVDFKDHKLCFLFLDSFDPDENLRYGYSPECIDWLAEQFDIIQYNWRVIIFSHLPPVARLQYWAKEIRGEKEFMRVLNVNSSKILAFINGHNHADLLDNNERFPIVSIANAKCEAFNEYKTDGFITPDRSLGDTTQELWDIMLVNPEKREIRFVRFGAGCDRIIANGKADWL